MGSSEFKPGTLARIWWPMTSGSEMAFWDDLAWVTESGIRVHLTTKVHLLLPVDPEDAEQMAAFDAALHANDEELAAAVRAMLAPDVEEPKVLGAVVRAGDWTYVRIRDAHAGTHAHWRNAGLGTGKHEHSWPDLPRPIEVISEGVEQ